jgi:hypothetical protein
MGQDLLRAKARQTMLDYILLESELPRIENANNVLVPQDNSLRIYDPNFVTFIREAISNGDFDQCTHQILSEAETTICHHALQKQGIHHLLLHASYPVTVCHSRPRRHKLFRFGMCLKTFLENPMVSYQNPSGMHASAGGICNVASTIYVLTELWNICRGGRQY